MITLSRYSTTVTISSEAAMGAVKAAYSRRYSGLHSLTPDPLRSRRVISDDATIPTMYPRHSMSAETSARARMISAVPRNRYSTANTIEDFPFFPFPSKVYVTAFWMSQTR